VVSGTARGNPRLEIVAGIPTRRPPQVEKATVHWREYAETRGNPPDCEVIITFDPRDAEHPYLRRRIAAYEACGKAVVLRPRDLRQQSRAGRQESVHAQRHSTE